MSRCLYITAADTKAVYRQMKANSNVQIVALKHGTREWIRISGTSDDCPILSKHYSAPTEEHFCIFRVQITAAYITTNEGKEILV